MSSCRLARPRMMMVVISKQLLTLFNRLCFLFGCQPLRQKLKTTNQTTNQFIGTHNKEGRAKCECGFGGSCQKGDSETISMAAIFFDGFGGNTGLALRARGGDMGGDTGGEDGGEKVGGLIRISADDREGGIEEEEDDDDEEEDNEEDVLIDVALV